jgi:hypothetical protein
MAVSGIDDIRLLPSVNPGLELADGRQRGAILGRQFPDFENVVGTDPYTVFLALAAIPVDERGDVPRNLTATCG